MVWSGAPVIALFLHISGHDTIDILPAPDYPLSKWSTSNDFPMFGICELRPVYRHDSHSAFVIVDAVIIHRFRPRVIDCIACCGAGRPYFALARRRRAGHRRHTSTVGRADVNLASCQFRNDVSGANQHVERFFNKPGERRHRQYELYAFDCTWRWDLLLAGAGKGGHNLG